VTGSISPFIEQSELKNRYFDLPGSHRRWREREKNMKIEIPLTNAVRFPLDSDTALHVTTEAVDPNNPLVLMSP